MSESGQSPKPRLGVFHVSCWMLGLVAFVQMMSVGVALALKGSVVPEVETKVVTEYVVVPKPMPVRVSAPKSAPKIVAAEVRPLDPLDFPELDLRDVPAVPRGMEVAPAIRNPVVEKLVEEAREARIRGDLVQAQTKLNEAEHLDPENANVLYDLALNFDALRVGDRADEYYLRVIDLGPLGAGSLFSKAAAKIELGRILDLKGLASLGQVRMAPPKRVQGGERRTVLLPISVAPGKDFDPELLDPRMHFFEEVGGKIQPAVIAPDGSGFQWVSEPVNWDDSEELAEVWYFVPDQDAREAFYAGDRKFHGLVVELFYDGRLVDMLAQPRTLAKKLSSPDPMEEWDDDLSPVLEAMENFNDTLLPPLEEIQGPGDLPKWDQ